MSKCCFSFHPPCLMLSLTMLVLRTIPDRHTTFALVYFDGSGLPQWVTIFARHFVGNPVTFLAHPRGCWKRNNHDGLFLFQHPLLVLWIFYHNLSKTSGKLSMYIVVASSSMKEHQNESYIRKNHQKGMCSWSHKRHLCFKSNNLFQINQSESN